MAKKSQRFRLRTISQSIQESKKFIDQDFVEQTQTYQESLETDHNKVAKWDIISGERQIIYNSTDQQITQQTLLTNLNGQYMILQFISENSLQLKVIYDFSKNNSLVSNLISFDSSNNQIQLSSNLVVQQFEKQMTVEQVILQNSNNLELSLSNKITCDTSLVGTVIQIINTQSLDEYFSIHENGIFHITISQNSCLIKLSYRYNISIQSQQLEFYSRQIIEKNVFENSTYEYCIEDYQLQKSDVIKQKAKQNMDIMKDKLIDLNKQSQNHSSVLQNSNNVLTQPSSPNQLLYKEKQKYNFQLYNRNSYPQEKTIFDYVNEDESQEDEQTQQLDPKKVEQYSLNTRPSFQQTLRQNIRLFDMNEQFTNS
ncbi:hypothetical protein ABPG74_015286 [Tetrahymena malaccensis]